MQTQQKTREGEERAAKSRVEGKMNNRSDLYTQKICARYTAP